MKCECEQCNGLGTIPCEECSGTGQNEVSVLDYTIPKDHDAFEALSELKSDAIRIEDQFRRLVEMKPACRKSYQRQRESVILELEHLAEGLDQ
jgi:DnaJ-class molecular chaperone